MTTPINKLNSEQQAVIERWCRQHDWGVNALVTEAGIQGLHNVLFDAETNESIVSSAAFCTLEELCDFAGYDSILGIVEAYA